MADEDIPGPIYGMTLRDWFAGQALAGLLAAGEMDSGPTSYAIDAYYFADAMMKARAADA